MIADAAKGNAMTPLPEPEELNGGVQPASLPQATDPSPDELFAQPSPGRLLRQLQQAVSQSSKVCGDSSLADETFAADASADNPSAKEA